MKKPSPNGQRAGHTLVSAGDRVTVSRDHRNGCLALFFLVWLIPWTAGCLAMGAMLLFGKGEMPWLFPIPFFVGEIAALAIFIASIAHREVLQLDREGLRHWHQAVARWNARRIPLDEIQTIRVSTIAAADDDGPGTTRGIVVEGINRPATFLGDLPPGEVEQIAGELSKCLATLRATVAAAKPGELPRMPADSRWQRFDDEDWISLTRRDGSTWTGCFPILGIALFWNSITGVFTGVLWGWFKFDNGQPKGKEWWFLLLFLIPFQLIGGVLTWGVAVAVAAPFWRETWLLERARIVRKRTWFGIGGHHEYDRIEFLRLDCLPENEGVADPPDAPPSQGLGDAGGGDEAGSDPDEDQSPANESWKLVFVELNGPPRIVWSGLSFGEAQWLGATVYQARRMWFREAG